MNMGIVNSNFRDFNAESAFLHEIIMGIHRDNARNTIIADGNRLGNVVAITVMDKMSQIQKAREQLPQKS